MKLLQILILLSWFQGFTQSARLNSFNIGDKFVQNRHEYTNYVLEQGETSLVIGYNLHLESMISVDSINEKGTYLSIRVKNIIDSVISGNSKLVYNSNKRSDSSSLIEAALTDIVSRNYSIWFDNQGQFQKIIGITPTRADSLLKFIGINIDQLLTECTTGLLPGFSVQNLKEAGSLTVHKKGGEEISKTKYSIKSNLSDSTLIAFRSELSDDYTNSNVNGEMTVHNSSNLITSYALKKIVIGYRNIHEVLCPMEMRTAMYRITRKL